MHPVYTNSPLKGRTATRALIAKSLGYANESDGFHRWGADSSRIVKAAISGITTSETSPDQGVIATEFFDAVAAGALIGKLPLRQIPFHVRMLALTSGVRSHKQIT